LGSEIKILLFILIGAFYLFSSFFKREKKKQDEKAINKRPVVHQTAEEIFRELQQSLRLSNEPKPEASRPSARVALTKEPMLEKKAPRKSIDPRQGKTSSKKTVTAVFEKTNQQKKEAEHLTLAQSLEFDPRKAVIFSEILKRPQY